MNIIKNTLIINGKMTERNEIRRYVRHGYNSISLDFRLILPYKQPFDDRGQLNALDIPKARAAVWGTPSLGENLVAEEHKAKLILNFDTLDSPPLPIVKHLIEANPHLYYIFYYEGPNFKGMIKARHGKVLKETYKEF